MDFENCTTTTNQPILRLEENRRSFRINNPNRISLKKVIVDGCLIPGTEEKCDYLVEYENHSLFAIFLELKGKDFNKAIAQIVNTMKLTSKEYPQHHRTAIVVVSRIPKAGTNIQLEKKRFKKQFNSNLEVSCTHYTMTI